MAIRRRNKTRKMKRRRAPKSAALMMGDQEDIYTFNNKKTPIIKRGRSKGKTMKGGGKMKGGGLMSMSNWFSPIYYNAASMYNGLYGYTPPINPSIVRDQLMGTTTNNRKFL
jgi:hypothetical protein